MRTRDAPATRVGVPREVEDGDAYARDGFRTSTTGFGRRGRAAGDAVLALEALAARGCEGARAACGRRGRAGRRRRPSGASGRCRGSGLLRRRTPRSALRAADSGASRETRFDAGPPTVRRGARRSQGLRALVDRELAAAALDVVDAVVRGAVVVLGPRRVVPDAPLRVADDAVAHAYEQNATLERDPQSLARALKNTFREKDAAADARARGASPCR